MNATDFIKQHGVDKAREVVEGAPDLAEYYSTIDGEYYRIELHAVNLRHLKRLVDSVAIVESLGGIDQAKLYISLNDNQHSIMLIYRMITSDEIKQAIADYESVYSNDMGGDTHIENHVSPLCKTESQPVFIFESDNQIIERLKAENVVLQAKVDELQVENKILNQAASTHLKNQMHFKKLYDALVEQLYPYVLDLGEPAEGCLKEYVDGYNRARECAHYNLLEMMKSNEEYIRAQCGMLGGGGAA